MTDSWIGQSVICKRLMLHVVLAASLLQNPFKTGYVDFHALASHFSASPLTDIASSRVHAIISFDVIEVGKMGASQQFLFDGAFLTAYIHFAKLEGSYHPRLMGITSLGHLKLQVVDILPYAIPVFVTCLALFHFSGGGPAMMNCGALEVFSSLSLFSPYEYAKRHASRMTASMSGRRATTIGMRWSLVSSQEVSSS
eukprot:scaffold647923_cov35-Prasinocladus_malaysianus.AAC.1